MNLLQDKIQEAIVHAAQNPVQESKPDNSKFYAYRELGPFIVISEPQKAQ